MKRNIVYVIIIIILLIYICFPSKKSSFGPEGISRDTITVIDTVTINNLKVDTVVFDNYIITTDTVIVGPETKDSIRTLTSEFNRATLTQSFRAAGGVDSLLSQELIIRDSVEYIEKIITKKETITNTVRNKHIIYGSYVYTQDTRHIMINYGKIYNNQIMLGVGLGLDNLKHPVVGISAGYVF